MSLIAAVQIQEGLSPNHLKKAKLMFFYTRYPSSNMLKMFFSDVKVSPSMLFHFSVSLTLKTLPEIALMFSSIYLSNLGRHFHNHLLYFKLLEFHCLNMHLL